MPLSKKRRRIGVGFSILGLIIINLYGIQAVLPQVQEDPGIDDNKMILPGLTLPTREDSPGYFVNATLDPDSNSITATMQFKVPVGYTSVPLSEIYLNIWPNGYLADAVEIHSVQDENGTLLTWSLAGQDQTKLKIDLPSVISPGEEAWFTLKFTDTFPYQASRYGYYNMSQTTEPLYQYNAGNWLPLLAVHDVESGGWVLHPLLSPFEAFFSRPSYFEVNLTVPSGMNVAASGSIKTKEQISSGITSWIWQTEAMTEFVFSAAEGLSAYSVLTSLGVNVTTYYWDLGEVSRELAREATETAQASIELFSDLFAKYPYPSMKLIAVPLGTAGMEYPDITFIQSGMFKKLKSLKGLKEVVSHEVGHAWFAYISDNDPYEEPWLDEAWASFCTALYLEYIEGDGHVDYIFQQRSNYMIEPKPANTTILNRSWDYWKDYDHLYALTVYDKGMIFVNMLRYQIGNDMFFDVMKAYFDRFGFKHPRIVDFISVVNDVTGESWNEFFDIFFNTETTVPFRGGEAWLDESSIDILLKVSVSQDADKFIPIRMPIRVTFLDNTSVDFFEWMTEPETVFNLVLTRSDVKEVRLDPYWTILDDMPSGFNRKVTLVGIPGTTSSSPLTSSDSNDKSSTIPIGTSSSDSTTSSSHSSTGTNNLPDGQTSNASLIIPLLTTLFTLATLQIIKRKQE